MKNIHVFQAELPVIAVIEEKLHQEEGVLFSPLLENQASKFGIHPDRSIVKLENGYKINFAYSWKKLPKTAIHEETERRIEASFTENGDMYGYELKAFQEEVFESVLAEYCAKVLPETIFFTAYYHTKSEKLIIDAKESFAQMAVSLLVRIIGSVETKTLHCSDVSNSLTTNMLECLYDSEACFQGIKFAGFNTGDLLVLGNQNKDVVRFKGDYPLEQVKELIEDGYKIKQINLSKDGVSFTLTEKFKIKQISTFFEIEGDDSFDDIEDLRLHEEAVELELIVNHCLTLKKFFDQSSDDEPEKKVEPTSDSSPADDTNADETDPLYDEAVAFIQETQRVSISSIQRKFRIGYNRAAQIVEQMEVNDVISEPGHNGSREVLKAA